MAKIKISAIRVAVGEVVKVVYSSTFPLISSIRVYLISSSGSNSY